MTEKRNRPGCATGAASEVMATNSKCTHQGDIDDGRAVSIAGLGGPVGAVDGPRREVRRAVA